MEDKIYTIHRIRFDGKWIEYWFKELELFPNKVGTFHECSKAYMFWNCIYDAELYDEIISNGVSGRKIKWKFIGSNYEPVEIF